jgi:hypothetical protein
VAFLTLFKNLLIPILKIVAVVVIAAFLVSWVAFIFAGYFVSPIIPAISPQPIISGYIGFFSGVISLGIIPLVMLIWLLFKVIWGYKIGARTRRAIFGVWIVTLILFATTALFSAKNYINEYSQSEVIIEETLQDKSSGLTFDLSSDYYGTMSDHKVKMDFGNTYFNRDRIVMKNIKVDLLPTKSEVFSVVKTCRATGHRQKEAEKNMTQVKHNMSFNDGVMVIPEYSVISTDDQYRRQCIEYSIKIPIGTQITLQGKTRTLNPADFIDEDITIDQKYIMTEKGLEKMELE